MRLLFVILLLIITLNGAEEKLSGEIAVDRAWIEGDDANTQGSEIRRAKLSLKGKFTPKLEYEVEYSFIGKKHWKDVKVKYKLLNALGIQAGNIKEPISLESLSSSKGSGFMGNSIVNTFMNKRKLGVVVQGHYVDGKHHGTLTFGIFGKSLDKLLAKKRDGTSIIGRITYALVHSKDSLVHIGASAGRTKYHSKSIKYSTDAGSHLYSGSLIKSKIKNVTKTKRVGLETAVVKGAFSFQGEYVALKAFNQKDSYDFDGWYGQVSFFLTGEHRKYKVKTAKFSRTKIKKHALQVAFRASKIRLQNKKHRPREEVDLTLAFDYYFKKNIRLMSSYTFAEVMEPSILKEHVLQVRGLYGF